MTIAALSIAVVACRGPVRESINRVARFPLDCKEEPASLQRVNIVAALRRYLAGELAASDVEAWAGAVEVRDALAYDPGVADDLFQLSNPEINRSISPLSARDVIERYDAAVYPCDPRDEAAGRRSSTRALSGLET